MSLRTFYGSPSGIVEATNRVRRGTLNVVTHAQQGSTGSCSVEVDDPAGDFFVAGWRRWYFIESEATSDAFKGVVWFGNTAQRVVKRKVERTDAARTWEVFLDDVNWRLSNRLVVGNDADRPEETTGQRLAWFLASTEMAFLDDASLINTSHSIPMDKNDYRGSKNHEVWDTLARETGFDFWLYLIPQGSTIERYGMFFDSPDAAVFSSSLRITNDLSDVDGVTTFEAAFDSQLQYEPSRVYSTAYVAGDGVWAHVTRSQTISEFSRRGGVFPAPHIKSKTKAERFARQQLAKNASEEEILSTGVLVPPELVNIAVAGQRVQVKFTHFDGLEDWTWLRVEKRTVRQLDDGWYWLLFDLSTDSATTAVAAGCTGLTATGSFHPLGGSGQIANASSGNVLYLRAGLRHHTEPTPTVSEHRWHFAQYGAGGAGTTDYAGDCTQNSVRCLVVGDGTIQINTATFGGSGRQLVARLQHADGIEPGVTIVTDEVKNVSSGSSVSFDVSTHGGVYCTHWVDVTDVGAACGGKWGFSGFDWTAT